MDDTPETKAITADEVHSTTLPQRNPPTPQKLFKEEEVTFGQIKRIYN